MSHFLNDDILYDILQHCMESSPNEPLTHRAQREALQKYALVSRMWSRIAQSFLFRHLFLQIRTAMLAFLEVVDHKTERGRRLASYVRVATIKLSRARESSDPPLLPMIHPRHLPALLAHLPSLHELRLRVGEEPFGGGELHSMKGLSSIRILKLSRAGPSFMQSYEIPEVLGLWSNLQSLSLEMPLENVALRSPPSFALREFHDLTAFRHESSVTTQWILKHSVGMLEHCTLNAVWCALDLRTALSDHFGTIRSLTLGQVQWDEEVCDALCGFANLIELRIVQSIYLKGPRFPGNLPNTLQHLTFVAPAYNETGHDKTIGFTNTIPTQLKTYTAIYRNAGLINSINEYAPFIAWATGYEQACRHMGVDVRLVSPRASFPRGELGSRAIDGRQRLSLNAEGETPPAMDPRPIIPQATDVIEPTPLQLALTNFDIVYTRGGAFKVNPSRPRMETPSEAKGALISNKRKSFLARLFKSMFRFFAPFSGTLMRSKNERFWGIHPLQFPAQVLKGNDGRTIRPPWSGLYSVRYLCIIYIFLLSIVIPARVCLLCHGTPGVLVSHGKQPQGVDSPKGSSNLTADSVISELSLFIVVRKVAKRCRNYLVRSINTCRVRHPQTATVSTLKERSPWYTVNEGELDTKTFIPIERLVIEPYYLEGIPFFQSHG